MCGEDVWCVCVVGVSVVYMCVCMCVCVCVCVCAMSWCARQGKILALDPGTSESS